MNHVDPSEINLLSLCSGGGQLDIGVTAALAGYGIRARHVAYAERQSEACAVLRSRMEDEALEPAPIWSGNLEQLPCGPFRGLVDGIVAGFPCQPHSVAGKRAGRDDERNLLPAILSVADAVGAWVLFLENVPGLKSEFDYICATLLQSGWNAQWGTIRAADVGASHRRDRWFGVAYRECPSGRAEQFHQSWKGMGRGQAALNGSMPHDAGSGILADSPSTERRAGKPKRGPERGASATRGCGVILADGQRPGLEGHGRHGDGGDQCGRLTSKPAGPAAEGRDELGNAARDNERRMPDGEHGEGLADRGPDGQVVVTAGRSGQLRKAGRPDGPDAGLPVFAPGPDDERWAGILSGCPFLAPAIPDLALQLIGDRMDAGLALEAESSICRVADGLAPLLGRARADMLRLIGNGVVAQQAAHAYSQLLTRI